MRVIRFDRRPRGSPQLVWTRVRGTAISALRWNFGAGLTSLEMPVNQKQAESRGETAGKYRAAAGGEQRSPSRCRTDAATAGSPFHIGMRSARLIARKSRVAATGGVMTAVTARDGWRPARAVVLGRADPCDGAARETAVRRLATVRGLLANTAFDILMDGCVRGEGKDGIMWKSDIEGCNSHRVQAFIPHPTSRRAVA